MAVGGVMVRPDSGVYTLADLRGKRLGVAGGPLDKSWLLLRGLRPSHRGRRRRDAREGGFCRATPCSTNWSCAASCRPRSITGTTVRG